MGWAITNVSSWIIWADVPAGLPPVWKLPTWLSNSRLEALGLDMEVLCGSAQICKLGTITVPVLQNGKLRSACLATSKLIFLRLEHFRDPSAQPAWCLLRISEVQQLEVTYLRFHTSPQQSQGSDPESVAFPPLPNSSQIHTSFDPTQVPLSQL